jgi:hypothetical protein
VGSATQRQRRFIAAPSYSGGAAIIYPDLVALECQFFGIPIFNVHDGSIEMSLCAGSRQDRPDELLLAERRTVGNDSQRLIAFWLISRSFEAWQPATRLDALQEWIPMPDCGLR